MAIAVSLIPRDGRERQPDEAQGATRMAIDFTSLTRPPAHAPGEPADLESRFPGRLCLLSVLLAAGLYYFLIFVVPAPRANASTLPARAALALGRAAEAHPVLAGAIGLGLLAPAFVLRRAARGYLLRLSALLAILWAAVFFSSSRPEVQAAEAVRSILSTERPFPETIRGK